MPRKKKYVQPLELHAYCRIVKVTQIAGLLKEVRRIKKGIKCAVSKIVWHVYYCRVDEEAKDLMQTRVAKEGGKFIRNLIEMKESGGRQQDNFVSTLSLDLWEMQFKKCEIVILDNDTDGGLSVHVDTFLSGCSNHRIHIVSEHPWDAELVKYQKQEMTPPKVIFHKIQTSLSNSSKNDGFNMVLFKRKLLGKNVQKLPAFKKLPTVLPLIDSNQIVIITGGTGCGKSSIIPSALRIAQLAKNIEVNIAVAQPRRLAAIQLCDRVKELTNGVNEIFYSETSYRIGFDNQTTANTTLEYCTYGCLRNMILRSNTLEGYTHVFLDEIHERSIDIDLVRSMLLPAVRDNHIKLVIMSATCSVNPMLRHFRDQGISEDNIATIDLTESENNKYKVQEVYLSEIMSEITQRPRNYFETAPIEGMTSLVNMEAPLVKKCIFETLEYELSYECQFKQLVDDYLGDAHGIYGEFLQFYSIFTISDLVNQNIQNTLESSNILKLLRASSNLARSDMCGGRLHETILNKTFDIRLNEHGIVTTNGSLSSYLKGISDRIEDLLPNDERIRLALLLLETLIIRGNDKGIIVFLPGYAEIQRLRSELLEKIRSQIEVYVLHSNVPVDVQDRVKEKTNKIKIILSTNSGESSLTIPDVSAVIDCCLGRYAIDSFSVQTMQVNRDAANQRRGRTGRTCNGKVYRLITEWEWSCMSQFRQPELLVKGLSVPLRQLLAASQTVTETQRDEIVSSLITSCYHNPITCQNRIIEKACLMLLKQGALSVSNPTINSLEEFRNTLSLPVINNNRDLWLRAWEGESICLDFLIKVASCNQSPDARIRNPPCALVSEGLSYFIRNNNTTADLLLAIAALRTLLAGTWEDPEADVKKSIRSILREGQHQFTSDVVSEVIEFSAALENRVLSVDTSTPLKCYFLTPLGLLQTKIQMDWQWAKFLTIAAKFGVATEACMAAVFCDTNRNFASTSQQSMKYSQFSSGTNSSCVIAVEIVQWYLHLKKIDPENVESKIYSLGITIDNMENICTTVGVVLEILERFNLITSSKLIKFYSQPLSSSVKFYLMMSWALAFIDKACLFKPPPKSTVHSRPVIPHLKNTLISDRSVVVSSTRWEIQKRDFYLSVGVESSECEEMTIPNGSWSHGSPTDSSEQVLVTFPQDNKFNRIWDANPYVWMAENYKSNPDIRVTACSFWRTDEDSALWAPFGSCTQICAKDRINPTGPCMPILSKKPVVVIPSSIADYRKVRNQPTNTMMNPICLPCGDGDGNDDNTSITEVLYAAQFEGLCRDAFEHQQQQFPITDLPPSTRALQVGSIEIIIGKQDWLRSHSFREFRNILFDTSCATPDSVIVARTALDELLKAADYSTTVNTFLESLTPHEEKLLLKYVPLDISPVLNEDFKDDSEIALYPGFQEFTECAKEAELLW